MTNRKRLTTQDALRQRAEQQAERRLPDLWREWLPTDLSHELGVYHLELELQNEALQASLAELELEREHYRILYEHAPTAYFTLNPQGDIFSANQASLHLLGVPYAHLHARRFVQFIAPAQRPVFRRLLADLLLTRSVGVQQFTLERQDGERSEVQLQAFTLPTTGTAQPGVLMTLTDVTPLARARTHLEQLNATLEDRVGERTRQLQELNVRLHHQALHDHLTGLHNRAAFTEDLHSALETLRLRGQPFAVLFCDLDRFKLINDTLGHAAGDQVLTELASRLQAVTRPSDRVARLGGDEFAMLLHDVAGLQMVLAVVERLGASIGQPVYLESREMFLTISTGVLLVSGRGQTAEQVLSDVDLALYQAKREGGAAARVFDPAMRDQPQR